MIFLFLGFVVFCDVFVLFLIELDGGVLFVVVERRCLEGVRFFGNVIRGRM